MFSGWENVTPYSVNGEDVKMYRELYTSGSIVVDRKAKDLDLLALNYLGSEIETYKLIDMNAVDILEQRGDMDRIKKVNIPNGQTI